KTLDGTVYQVTGTIRRSSAALEDGDGDGSTYNLRVWCADEDYNMISEMLEAYKVKYPSNKYNFTLERLGEDVVSGTVMKDPEAAADVFSFANDQLGWLIKSQALTQIPAQYTAQIESQIEVARIAASYNNTYYAMPYSYENCFLYYNKNLITDVSSVEGILKANIPTANYNLCIDMSDSYYTTAFLYTAGVEIFGPNGDDPESVDINNENAYTACRYIRWLNSQQKLESINNKNDQIAALQSGKIAAIISGPHMISSFKSALGANFAVATLPSVKFDNASSAKKLVSFSGVKMYGITRKSAKSRDEKTTAEAIKLAAYLSNAENQTIRLEKREFCPTQSDIFSSAVDSGIDAIKVVVDQSRNSKLKPGLTQMDNYWGNMSNFLNGVYRLARAEDTWPKYLADIQKKLAGE
ncbi:MAG: extracellular solute-binding protein, partial [Clostridia bacterium]|nr:extracellular solute-binding protein [Clostridia bacterium]